MNKVSNILDYYAGTLTHPATDTEIDFALLQKAYHVIISNDDTVDMALKWNSTGSIAATLKAGETITFPECNIEKLFISTVSADVDYRIFATGE